MSPLTCLAEINPICFHLDIARIWNLRFFDSKPVAILSGVEILLCVTSAGEDSVLPPYFKVLVVTIYSPGARGSNFFAFRTLIFGVW